MIECDILLHEHIDGPIEEVHHGQTNHMIEDADDLQIVNEEQELRNQVGYVAEVVQRIKLCVFDSISLEYLPLQHGLEVGICIVESEVRTPITVNLIRQGTQLPIIISFYHQLVVAVVA